MTAGMDALQARFRERASRDMELLGRCLAAGDPGAPEVETTAHKLAGAAGLFGYAEVGQAAHDIDRVFGAGLRPGREMIEILIDRLGAVVGEEPADSPAEPPADAPGGGETILVVEDDEVLRTHAEGQLRRLGYQVIGATDGDEVLAALDALPPIDLLFTDLTLPGETGGEALARAIRLRRPGLRVLFTSGRGAGQDGAAGEFLPKPYRRDALAAMVRRVLDSPAIEGLSSNPPDRPASTGMT